MRKLIMKMNISIDGFVCGPQGEFDWVFKTGDPAAVDWQVEKFRTLDMIIMGRKSFEVMAPYWPVAPGPLAAPMNEIPKGVFTKKGFSGIADLGLKETDKLSPAAATWTEARVFSGDLATEIRQLKEEDGKPIGAIGGAGFMQSLVATGLIDEFYLLAHPVALGQGMPIFSALGNPLYLKLADVKTFASGAIVHAYHAI